MGEVVTAILYSRVSTEEQGRKGYSLPEQRRECRARAEALAARAGARLDLYEFEDTASGEILERPGLEACRQFLRRRETRADYFICLDPDRFARGLFLQLLVTEEIEKAGIRLVFVQHDYQNTAEGRLFYQLRGAISEFEKAKIKERTARGRRGKLAAGQIPNRVQPWGYTWDKESKTLRIDPKAAPWVQQVFRWYLQDWSYLRIAARLAELGVPAPGGGAWYRRTIQRILQNPAYVGRLVVNKWDAAGRTPLRKVPREKRRALTAGLKPRDEWVTLPVPPLISEEDWARVRERHRNRTRLSQPGVGLLSGLCICGLCGGGVHYAGAANRRYLRCPGRYPHLRDTKAGDLPACTLKNLRADRLEAAVWARVRAWLLDPAELQQWQAQVTRAPERDTVGERAALLQAQLAEKQEEHRRMFRLAARGLAPAGGEDDLARLAAQVRALEGELASLAGAQGEAPLARAKADPAPADPAGAHANQAPAPEAGISNLARQVGEALDALNLQGRQHVARTLLRGVVIHPDYRWVPQFHQDAPPCVVL